MGYCHKSYNGNESEFYLFVTSQTQLFKVASTENYIKDIQALSVCYLFRSCFHTKAVY